MKRKMDKRTKDNKLKETKSDFLDSFVVFPKNRNEYKYSF